MPGHSTFQRIWMPGFVLQSVVIGGGYATGRELIEFFLKSGPVGGLLGLLVATAMFSIVAALCFELARLTGSYDYRSFFQKLLGPGWFVYELAYFVLGLLVLAVVGSAAGEIAATNLGVSSSAATLIFMILIGVLVFWGTTLIERALAGWSFVLTATFIVLAASYLWQFGDELRANLSGDDRTSNWLGNGVRYAGYNLVAVPVILFCARHMTSRRDAFTAGVLAGPIAMLPGCLLYLAMVAAYPAVLDASVPSEFLMQRLDLPWLQIIFYIVVFGTLVETGTAFIHAANERIAEGYRARGQTMHPWLRLLIAMVALVFAVVLAGKIGLIDLIAKGYGTLTWVFIFIFVIPVCTLGAWKIWRWKGNPGGVPAQTGKP